MPRSFLSKLTGSFSEGAAENPTVAMVEAAYQHHGLDTVTSPASAAGKTCRCRDGCPRHDWPVSTLSFPKR